jgi:hypothetical protein
MLMLQAGGMEEGEPGALGERIELLGFAGMHGGKVVKGVPFTATATSESTQILSDGNRIVRNTQTQLFRDSQGRFRKEVSLPALAASGQPHSFIVISDPVAGAGYLLQPDEKIARKMPGPPGKLLRGHGAGGEAGSAESVDGNGNFLYREWKGAKKSGAAGKPEVQTDSLGTQMIAGVNAEGTRYTRTIAAGEIGNDQPIVIVSERWYSPDLQLVVMSKRSDPRFGNSTYTLSNIQRQEPAASLFTVPSDYTVKEGGPGWRARQFRGGPPPADAPAPPPAN